VLLVCKKACWSVKGVTGVLVGLLGCKKFYSCVRKFDQA
jgi:hypothetical protein